MLAAMLRQSTAGGSGGGGGSSGSGGGGGGIKLPAGISRLSSSSVGSAGPASMGHWGPGRVSKSGSVSSDSSDIPASDPNYIMQLVSDVRKFADVLLQLKEVFNSKGIFFFLGPCRKTHTVFVISCSVPQHSPLSHQLCLH